MYKRQSSCGRLFRLRLPLSFSPDNTSGSGTGQPSGKEVPVSYTHLEEKSSEKQKKNKKSDKKSSKGKKKGKEKGKNR